VIWFRALQAVTGVAFGIVAYHLLRLMLTNGHVLIVAAIFTVLVSVRLLASVVVDEFRRIFPKDVL
jgi:P pilus assembly chaperone PapD